jgi:hypothetical protein
MLSILLPRRHSQFLIGLVEICRLANFLSFFTGSQPIAFAVSEEKHSTRSFSNWLRYVLVPLAAVVACLAFAPSAFAGWKTKTANEATEAWASPAYHGGTRYHPAAAPYYLGHNHFDIYIAQCIAGTWMHEIHVWKDKHGRHWEFVGLAYQINTYGGPCPA